MFNRWRDPTNLLILRDVASSRNKGKIRDTDGTSMFVLLLRVCTCLSIFTVARDARSYFIPWQKLRSSTFRWIPIQYTRNTCTRNARSYVNHYISCLYICSLSEKPIYCAETCPNISPHPRRGESGRVIKFSYGFSLSHFHWWANSQ